MKKTRIVFKWKSANETNQRLLDRKEVFGYFDKLAKEHPDDNEISLKLLGILPEVDEFFIDEDANDTREVPMVEYIINGRREALKIMRCHKIVWGQLDKYCQKV